MSQTPFQKFISAKKNSVVKEAFRQEKKQARKEKNAYFDKLKEEKYQARMAKKNQSAATNTKAKNLPSGKTNAPKTGNTTVQKSANPVMPLNKYIAHCGVCSRREAIELITKGLVKVNGKAITEPGYKVQPADEVNYNNKKLFVTKNLVYILLNKPKDYITTTDDPQGRKTVLQLIQQATTERVYPIGRLDRNTSGVLLLTNDGDLTQKLSHPSYQIKKIYEVRLDKNLIQADFDKILNSLILEDGPVLVDSLAYADSRDKSIIGIEIHSGRNRIVRRIFESLGYDVKGLDRVMYAGLTKKNVERSKWRYLSEKEIRILKYLNESKKKSSHNPEAVSAEKEIKKTFSGSKKSDALKLSNKEIYEAIGEQEPAKKQKEPKTIKPRKYKTHSEKKNNSIGKK
ncbi:MAG: pseudouridine synthase [Bacteroidetes bacterium]|nr:pseudouridine synthase [Bacteroidota bacterium]MBS1758130.1 pseudouridine synthase [Bacteroidota bacterium]